MGSASQLPSRDKKNGSPRILASSVTKGASVTESLIKPAIKEPQSQETLKKSDGQKKLLSSGKFGHFKYDSRLSKMIKTLIHLV